MGCTLGPAPHKPVQSSPASSGASKNGLFRNSLGAFHWADPPLRADPATEVWTFCTPTACWHISPGHPPWESPRAIPTRPARAGVAPDLRPCRAQELSETRLSQGVTLGWCAARFQRGLHGQSRRSTNVQTPVAGSALEGGSGQFPERKANSRRPIRRPLRIARHESAFPS